MMSPPPVKPASAPFSMRGSWWTMTQTRQLLLLLVVVLATVHVSHSSEQRANYLYDVPPRSYAEGERVELNVNKLSSTMIQMPLEYYILPYCRPESGIEMANQTLGQFLAGDRIMNSPYYLEMKKDMYCEQLCVSNMGRPERPDFAPNKMVKAIRNQYHNNWLLDNLPAAIKVEDEMSVTTRFFQGSPVGFIAKDTKLAYVNNHVNLEIMYHPVENEADKYRVVRFTVEPFSIAHDFEPLFAEHGPVPQDERSLPAVGRIRNPIESCAAKSSVHTSYDMVTDVGRLPQIASGQVLFTYDVIWIETHDLTWANRWDIYVSMGDMLPNEVHLFNIANSLIVIVALSAVIAVILSRNLRRNLDEMTKCAPGEGAPANGWKALHADVFRPPSFSPVLLSVCCGTGAQLLFTGLLTTVAGAFRIFSPALRGSLVVVALGIFIVMGAINGYVSARLYKTFTGTSSRHVTLVSALAFPGVALGMSLSLMYIARDDGIADDFPLVTVPVLLFTFSIACISALLAFAGGYVGFQQATLSFPTRTSPIPRPIPDQPWLLSSTLKLLASGLLPFVAIYVDLNFIMSSAWMEFYYHTFGFLFTVNILFLVTCAEISVLSTYTQLRKEDHRWWWRSFVYAGAPAVSVFALSGEYVQQIEATAMPSYAIFFGCMTLASIALFLILGSVGVAASLWFNKVLYSSTQVKVESGLEPLLQKV